MVSALPTSQDYCEYKKHKNNQLNQLNVYFI